MAPRQGPLFDRADSGYWYREDDPMDVIHLLKLLGLATVVALARVFVGVVYFRGPDIDYLFNSDKPLGRRLGLFALLVLGAFGLVILVSLYYGDLGL